MKTLIAKPLDPVRSEVMTTVTEIMDNVMELPRTDRSYIARKLIESLDREASHSPEWMEEIEKRVARRESGESQSVSREVVHADIEKLLAR